MKVTVVAVSAFLAILPFASANTPIAPLPDSSYTGININLQMLDWLGETDGGGGEFSGSVTKGGNTVYTNFWCVDFQEAFYFGQSSKANITTLADIGTNSNQQVRYSNVGIGGSPSPSTPQWLNATADGSAYALGNPKDLPTDAQSRYEMAAYLVMQYTGFNTTIAQDHYDNAIQNAIWALTDNSGYGSPGASGIYELGHHSTLPEQGDPNWVQLALDNYQIDGRGANPVSWAVVSWGADANGNLNTGPYYSDTGAMQTFLVQIDGAPSVLQQNNSTVPEPGLYGLLAVGFGVLSFVVARRKSV